METWFYLDRYLVKGIAVIFIACWLVMMGAAALVGRFFVTLNVSAILGCLIALFWLSFTRGVYITVDGKSVYGTVFWIRGKVTRIGDIVSIHRNPTFAGLMAEVVMKVRRKDGAIVERGLTNKPGVAESDFKKLLEAIRSINPHIEIDQDVLDK
jgi:hypothetical protein